MSCYQPLLAKINGKKENGKFDLTILGKALKFNNSMIQAHLHEPDFLEDLGFMLIPCGSCTGCRLDYRREWANRLMVASESVEYKYFITLTYDDENYQKTKTIFVDDDKHHIVGYSLIKSDLQLFFKRLRKYAQNKCLKYGNIQYYACGEYGEKNGRPHYHIILFNFKIPDLVKEYNRGDYEYFQSKIITDLWSKGRTQVCNISYDTCSYTAGYVMKKMKGKSASDYYFNKGILPEFVVMSRRPAIGNQYYHDNKYSIYSDDGYFIQRKDRVKMKVKPARYFDKLFDIDCPDELKRIKRLRKLSYDSSLVLCHTDKYYMSYLKTKEANKNAELKMKRSKML